MPAWLFPLAGIASVMGRTTTVIHAKAGIQTDEPNHHTPRVRQG
jgi:hypothetical protein